MANIKWFYLHIVESKVRTRALRLTEANRSMVPWSRNLRIYTNTSSGIPLMCIGSVSSSRSNVRVCGKPWTILEIALFGIALALCVSSEMCRPKRRSTMLVYRESAARSKNEGPYTIDSQNRPGPEVVPRLCNAEHLPTHPAVRWWCQQVTCVSLQCGEVPIRVSSHL